MMHSSDTELRHMWLCIQIGLRQGFRESSHHRLLANFGEILSLNYPGTFLLKCDLVGVIVHCSNICIVVTIVM